jgi:hypothetical protein
LRDELAPLVALALAARAEPGLATEVKAEHARLLVAEAARVYPPASGPSRPSGNSTAPGAPGAPFLLGPAALGVIAALLLSVVISSIGASFPGAEPAPATPTTRPELQHGQSGGVPSPRTPGLAGTQPARSTDGATAEYTASASPSATASASATPSATAGAAPALRPAREPRVPSVPASPSPTATIPGYPFPTPTQEFAPTATAVPYP